MYIVMCSKAYLQTPFAEPLPARSRPNLTAEATSHLNMDMLVGFYDHGTPSGLVFDSSLQNNVRQEIRKCFFDIFRGLCVSPQKNAAELPSIIHQRYQRFGLLAFPSTQAKRQVFILPPLLQGGRMMESPMG
jgi:hypothetical protein